MKKLKYVFDSYALLAYLGDEPGADEVEALLRRAEVGETVIHLSLINLGEIAYITERRYGTKRLREVLSALTQLPLQILEASWERVIAAAHIKACHAISYADAFAIALAEEKEALVVTGDPQFKKVEHLVQVIWL